MVFLHSGRREPEEADNELGSRDSKTFHPASNCSFRRAVRAARRLSIEATVCGNQGKTIVVIEFSGRFAHRPPGSWLANSPRQRMALPMQSGSQARVSRAHRRPVM